MKKAIILFSVLVCLIGSLQVALAAPEGPLVIGLPAGIPSLDPVAMNLTDSGLIVGRLVFNSLFGIDEKGKIYPQLAASWKWVDEKTLRVNLRKGVKFHNGEPFTASDVKFTIEWLMNPENKWQGIRDFASFDQVVIIDDYSLDLKYKNADLATFNRWAARVRIYSKKLFDKNGVEGLRNNAIGTGAFKFVSWKRDDQLVVEANNDWYLGKPKVKTIIFKFLPEMASRVAEFQAGSAHIIPGIPPFMVTELKKMKGVDVQTALSLRATFMDIDTINVPELRDKRVRQALNYAVDKEAIIKGVLNGMAKPLGTHVPVLIPGIDPSINPYPYDPEKAKALLREAGYPNGFSLDLYSSSGNHPMDKEVTLAVADQLLKVGIKSNTNIMETNIYLRDFITHKLKGGIYFFSMAYNEWEIGLAVNMLDSRFPTCFIPDKAVDEMVAKFNSMTNPDERIAMAQKIQKLAHDDAFFLFLYNGLVANGVSNKVSGFKTRADAMMDLWDVSLGN